MNPKKAIYAGSFDVVHNGHINIINRASKLFDLTVLVANNPSKKYLFGFEERINIIKHLVGKQISPEIKVEGLFSSMLVADYAYRINANVLIRGIRNFGDYDVEKMMRDVNIGVQHNIETVFLTSEPTLSHISSGAVKELYNHGAFIHDYVPMYVKQKIEQKNKTFIIGVTGSIGCGKTTICKYLHQKYGINYINLDVLIADLLYKNQTTPILNELRKEIRAKLLSITNPLGQILSIDEHKMLADTVFQNKEKLNLLNKLMRQPVLTFLRNEISKYSENILIEGALLAEFDLLHICNNNVLVVTSPKNIQLKNLKKRGLTEEQINARIHAQLTGEEKIERIQNEITKHQHGNLAVIENDGVSNPSSYSIMDVIKTWKK